MAQSRHTISDMTIEEFVALVRATVRKAIADERQAISGSANVHPQAGILDIEPASVGEWKPGLALISREEYYDDER
jgi:hypothetical protein